MQYLSDQLNKCKNDKQIYKLLYKIRIQHANNEEDLEKLLKHKLVGQLASLLGKRIELQSPSEENNKIIEVLLSILANCTYNNINAATQVFETNITEHMLTIINKSDNQVLSAKSCRLIGNLIQNEQIGLSFQQAGVALSLSNCLSENSIPVLNSMAVRTIRLMWKSKKFRQEILSFNNTIFKIILCLRNALRSELKTTDNEKSEVVPGNMVILKREKEPDRLISKEKLSSILTKMEKHNVETKYEILKPEKKNPSEFTIPSSKENFELISGILKLLLTMTFTSALITQIAKSVYADGIAIPCLLFLIEESSKFRESCLKILSNLSYSSNSHEFLGVNNELIPTISSLLINSEILDKPLKLNEQKYCLEIVCLSTENSCNRLKLKRSGVFKTMLSIASNTTVQDELNLLIFAFFQYRYDEDSLSLLIQLNLINVLVKIIANLIENKEVDHLNNDDSNTEVKEEQKIGQKRKRVSVETICYTGQNKFMRFESSSPSTSSGYGSYQYSPSRSSSDGYSPYNSPRRCYQDYNSDSNEYSPVCSDNEGDNNDGVSKKQTKDFDILDYIYGNDEIGKKRDNIDDETSNLTLNDRDSEDENESNKAETTQNSINSNSNNSKNLENVPETLKCIEADKLQYVLLLLWKVSINHSDALAFVNSSNLSTLIKVFGLIQKPNEKIYQILQNIIEQTRNFVPIFMRQDFVFKILETTNMKYDHINCYSCEKMKSSGMQLLKDFRKVAESGYGEGEITHCLKHDADTEMKRKIAIKLTFVISSVELLNKFLFTYNALELIMDTILMDDKYLSVAACNGITILSNNLNIRLPSEDDVFQRIIPDNFNEEVYDTDPDKELAKFILKDGVVSFDKETLKNSSEVFNSMFSSGFMESSNNEVKFSNYTVYGMKYFFQLVKMSNENRLKPIAPKVNDMDVVLQAYELSILYILTNIQQPLLNVIKIILDETNVRKIFEWSLNSINQELLISSICFYLVGPIDGKTKLNLYLEANKSQYSKEWKELIFDSILMKCKPVDD